MNRSEDSQVRQGSRIVTATARQALAREKARITGKKAGQPSALEVAAAEWEKQQEAQAGKAEEERLRIPRQVEASPFSRQQVSLQANDNEPPQDEVDWEPYNPGRREEEEKGTAKTVTRRVGMAGVCALSRRLMAIERGRALGRKPVDLRAYALEQAGRRWAEERARQKL